MRQARRKRPLREPLPAALLGLTLASGMLDAASFLGLGKIFVAMMTGNFIVLGLALGGAAGFSDLLPLTAIAGFATGILLGGHAERLAVRRARQHWFFHAMAVEVCLLLAAWALNTCTPSGYGPTRYMTTALLSLAMGTRCATVRRLGIPDLPITVGLTGALIALVHDSRLLKGDNEHAARRLGTVMAMVAGAALGGALVVRHGLPWALLAIALTVALITCAVRLHPRAPQ
ncbi:YoaK family protein [Streptomyces luteireticuli]|uniref:YoaK family protein n=1 Tax=Streptomyces luteireticuli TaxID=173858 RepID=UPI00355712FA